MDEAQPVSRAEHFAPPVDEARIDRQWARIEAHGLPDGRRPAQGWLAWLRLGLGVGIGGALVAAAVFFFVRDPAAGPHAGSLAATRSPSEAQPVALAAGSVLQSEVEPVVMGLSDGSKVELLPRTRLSLEREREDAVELSLEAGVARFAVTRRPGRRFSVRAGEMRVTVVGTRFELRREGRAVELRVSEGVVEVRVPGAGEARRVVAGEHFGWDPSARDQLAAAAQPALDQDALDDTAAQGALDDTAAQGAPDGQPPRRSARKPSRPAPLTPAEIFEGAHLARRSGRLAEAAAGYQQLVTEHADDRRAGLSAFELGRIRMDALDNPRGAIHAFKQALALAGSDAYREDAMARIALAHDALGEQEACRGARARYLSRYPRGVHRAALSSRCGDADK